MIGHVRTCRGVRRNVASNPHDMNCVTDHVGGALLAFGVFRHRPLLCQRDAKWSGRMNLDHSVGFGPQVMVSAGPQDHDRSRNEGHSAGPTRISVFTKCHEQFAGDDSDQLVGRMRMICYFVSGRELDAHGVRFCLREIAVKRGDLGAGRQTCKGRPNKGVRLDDHPGFGGVCRDCGLASRPIETMAESRSVNRDLWEIMGFLRCSSD